jgi:DNA-binding XRE family transcriptional regulator
VTCPDCHGDGVITGMRIACGPVHCEPGMFEETCRACAGTGSITDAIVRYRHLAAELREIRERHDLSQREMAAVLGMRPIDLNQAEHGRVDPTSVLEKARAVL